MEGNILLIDKPKGMTSHDVVNIIRRQEDERRVGHAGTLDPLATGLLIVLVGRDATKRQSEFMGLPKVYEADLTFGSVSDTYDAEGPITPSATAEQLAQLDESTIQGVLQQFIGQIKQQPPKHSAIKIGGRPMYKKARAGTLQQEDVPERTVQIDSIEILSFSSAANGKPPTAQLRVRCQKGTYIRSLAHDIGQALGTGAYLSELRRTAIGEYSVDDAQIIHNKE
ncbi:MAG: tRNA pseudouridine(55) synthase TruB [Candidatus Kerfeldbacteria bacterium]